MQLPPYNMLTTNETKCRTSSHEATDANALINKLLIYVQQTVPKSTAPLIYKLQITIISATCHHYHAVTILLYIDY